MENVENMENHTGRHPVKKLLAMLLAVVMIVGAYPAAADAASSLSVKIAGRADYTAAFKVLNLVNKERKKLGLSSLSMDQEMLDAAMTRAAETNVYYSHTRPDGTSCMTAFPSGLNAMGENIAAGYNSAAEVMAGWMSSPGHKANILDEHGYGYNVIGVGCYKAGNTCYWVQTFGRKQSVNKAAKGDYKNGTLKKTVKTDPSSEGMPILNTAADKQTIQKGGKTKIHVYLTNSTFDYDTYALSNGQFTFTSSNKKVADVDSKGVVRGRKAGTAKIRVAFTKGGRKAGKLITIKVQA